MHVVNSLTVYDPRMAKADAAGATKVSTSKYAIVWMIALWAAAMCVIYDEFYDTRPSSAPPRAVSPDCAAIKRHQTAQPRRNLTPPWFHLLADYQAAIRSGRNLYVRPRLTKRFRLGNVLFNYAATFGIAWRNGRIPLWPDRPLHRKDDVARLFSVRVPVDRDAAIMRVSSVSYSCIGRRLFWSVSVFSRPYWVVRSRLWYDVLSVCRLSVCNVLYCG